MTNHDRIIETASSLEILYSASLPQRDFLEFVARELWREYELFVTPDDVGRTLSNAAFSL